MPPKKRRLFMALTRKLLASMGIDDDKADEIIKAHAETVEALKEERDNYKAFKADAENLPKVKKELEDLKAEIEKNGKNNPYEEKYNELKKSFDTQKAEYDSFKSEVAAKELTSKKEKAYRKLLKDAGVSEKRIDTILKVTDLSKIELDEDGSIKEAEKFTESIKAEWSDFIETQGKHGADENTPPTGQNGGKGNSGRAAQLATQYHDNRYGANKEE